MTTTFPTTLQDLDAARGASGNPLSSPNHITHHTTEDDTIEALQAKVGVDNSAVPTSLDYKVSSTSSSNPGHKHTLANGATDVTATASEVNKLAGTPAGLTSTEIGYLDGVTSAIQTQLDLKALDSTVVHDTGAESIDGVKTFTSDPLIPDEAYGSGWNGVLEPPTKNALYDKIELLPSLDTVPNTVPTVNTFYTYEVPLFYDDASATNGFVGWANSNIGDPSDLFGAGGVGKILSSGGSSYLYAQLPGTGSAETYVTSDGKQISVRFRLKMSSVANVIAFGLTGGATNAYSDQTDVGRGVRFVENAGTLYAHNANGTTATTTDVSSGITRTNWNTYEFVLDPGVNIKYYINGTLVATHTTNLPTTSQLLLVFGLNTTTQYVLSLPPIISLEV